MTKLHTLHRQLNSLRRVRRSRRWIAAHSAWLMAVVLAVAAVFVLDVIFSLSIPQRLVVIGLGVFAVIWAFRKYSLPYLGVDESEIDLALQVERQQQISSDLVAAIQFEDQMSTHWGSLRLQQAVIDNVSTRAPSLNVFAGFSGGESNRRAIWLALVLLAAAAAVFLFPQHAKIFGQRLLLGNAHYPSWTRIDVVSIHGKPVLLQTSAERTHTPTDIRLAEGEPLEFVVQCSGRLPEKGEARLYSGQSSAVRVLPLEILTTDQRRIRLEEARTRIEAAIADPQIDVVGPWTDEVAELLRYDAPNASAMIAKTADDRGLLSDASAAIDDHLEAWPGNAGATAVYRARLDRLVEPVRYQLFLGDAWTEPARIDVIPAPAVEVKLSATVPAYARSAQATSSDSGNRQLATLEGSRIDVSAVCTNGKRLERVWISLKDETETTRFDLAPADAERQQWTLKTADTPFEQITRPLRFELQVTDEDGLHLPAAARAYISIRPDRPPTGTAEVVHRVVLPTARPSISFRVTDDYGVASVRLRMQVEKARSEPLEPMNSSEASSSESPADAVATSADTMAATVDILMGGPLLADKLPYRGQTPVDLAPLGLAKGDRLRLTLEVTDYRGEMPGQNFLADPLILEISDESGVLAAISEADERSEERMTDIIKQQLGIGETP